MWPIIPAPEYTARWLALRERAELKKHVKRQADALIETRILRDAVRTRRDELLAQVYKEQEKNGKLSEKCGLYMKDVQTLRLRLSTVEQENETLKRKSDHNAVLQSNARLAEQLRDMTNVRNMLQQHNERMLREHGELRVALNDARQVVEELRASGVSSRELEAAQAETLMWQERCIALGFHDVAAERSALWQKFRNAPENTHLTDAEIDALVSTAQRFGSLELD